MTHSCFSFHHSILVLVLMITLVTVINSLCPNACSGHGYCEDFDICICYEDDEGNPAWQRNDCSERTCPMAYGWIGHLVKANDVHPMAECSNKVQSNFHNDENDDFNHHANQIEI